MLANVVDHRTNKYDVGCDVVLEPSWHDNSIAGATQFESNDSAPSILVFENVTVTEGASKAESYDLPMTMFLYDRNTAMSYNRVLGL